MNKKQALIIFTSILLFACKKTQCNYTGQDHLVNFIFIDSLSLDTLNIEYERVYAVGKEENINPATYDEEDYFRELNFVLPLSPHQDTTQYIFETDTNTQDTLTFTHPWETRYRSEECGFSAFAPVRIVEAETSFRIDRFTQYSDYANLYQITILR